MGLQILFTGHAGEDRFQVDESAGRKVQHAHVCCILSADIPSHQTRPMIVLTSLYSRIDELEEMSTGNRIWKQQLVDIGSGRVSLDLLNWKKLFPC